MGKNSCSVCSKKCIDGCIYCETCGTWVHYKCDGIHGKSRNNWEKKTIPGYVCVQCRSDADGGFDFLMGLERLKQGAKMGMSKFRVAVNRELLFLDEIPAHVSLHDDFSKHRQDPVANDILTNYHVNKKVALACTGDGDCLFNAFSILLAGNESRSVELRYRCCLEMVTGKDKIIRHKLYPRLSLLSPDYDEDCLDCSRLGSYSSIWRMMALSNALQLSIETVYPFVNGSKHLASTTMNTVFRPQFANPDTDPISIMWTSMSVPPKVAIGSKRKREWLPRHFVPLVEIRGQHAVTDVNSNSGPPDAEGTIPRTANSNSESHSAEGSASTRNTFLNSATPTSDPISDANAVNSNGPTSVCTTVNTNCGPHATDSQNFSANTANPISETRIADTISGLDTADSSSELPVADCLDEEPTNNENPRLFKSNPDLSVIIEESFEADPSAPVSRSVSTEKLNVNESSDISLEDESNNERQTDIYDFQPGPLGNNFMDIRSTLSTFKRPYTALPEIPGGRKDGFYFIVDNTDNNGRRDRGERSAFYDDCGAWKKAACPVSLYIFKNEKLVSVVKRNGEYCSEKMVSKKRVFIPLIPQPSPSDILEIHRLYQTLKASPSGPHQFKRRITWIGNAPNSHPEFPHNVALVEYIGTFPPRTYHGNVKHLQKNKKFIRTKESVKNILKDTLKYRTVKDVERHMNNKTENDADKQRDLKQLENMKYTLQKASRNSEMASNNAADHVIIVEEMTKTHPFVKSVKHIKGVNHPVVTLYTDQQITDIKRFCCKPGVATPLGIDKTYNIGEFHVTPTVYKDLSVLRRTSFDHPICFGPTFIHTSSTTKVYSSFMHEIADNLSDTELTNLTIGSDEELAFKSSINRCFIGSTHVLCTRHLKQNVNKYMEDQAGYPKKDRQELLDGIFGADGLTESTDIDTFNTRLSRLRTKIDEKDSSASLSTKTFRCYFDQKLASSLFKHVIQPRNEGKIPLNWTNNNCESANHILKSATNWKVTDIPKFIKLLYEIVTSEQTERSRAIRDMGNFKLHESYSQHLVDIDRWTNLSQEQKTRRVNRFLLDGGRGHQNVVISTDGTRTVVKSASAGKKPNQVKRKRAERSRTPNAKRRLLTDV